MQALRAGVTVLEFWDLTPRETFMAIAAAIWRDEQAQRQQIALAWRTAALTRAKKLPTLKQLLTPPAKPLAGAELERRRQEFEQMGANLDYSKIGKVKKDEPTA